MTDLSFRPALAADLALVYGTWLASFRLSHSAGPIPMATYGAVYTDAIGRLLARPTVAVTVACHPDEQPGAADLYGEIGLGIAFLCSGQSAEYPSHRGRIDTVEAGGGLVLQDGVFFAATK